MKTLLTSAALLVAIAATSVCQAAGPRADAKYSSRHISFNYPKSWTTLPASAQKSFKTELSTSAGSSAKVSALGGVLWTNKKQTHAAIAVLAQMTFTPKYQKAIKGNHKLFINKFDGAIKSSASKVIGNNTHAKFAGHNNADELQVELKKGSNGRYAFYIAIAPNNKTVDLGVMVTEPISVWGKYSSMLSSIASSSRFK